MGRKIQAPLTEMWAAFLFWGGLGGYFPANEVGLANGLGLAKGVVRISDAVIEVWKAVAGIWDDIIEVSTAIVRVWEVVTGI